MNGNNIRYSDSFEVEHISQEIDKIIRNKNITTNIYKTQTYNSMIRGYICIRFIGFMLKGKRLDYANLFSPNEYENNDKIIQKYFQ